MTIDTVSNIRLASDAESTVNDAKKGFPYFF